MRVFSLRRRGEEGQEQWPLRVFRWAAVALEGSNSTGAVPAMTQPASVWFGNLWNPPVCVRFVLRVV